jgi:replicative DNA helicase
LINSAQRDALHADDCEIYALSCMFHSEQARTTVMASLSPKDFFSPGNRRLFTTLASMVKAGIDLERGNADIVVDFAERNHIEGLDAFVLLAAADGWNVGSNAAWYASQLSQLRMRRDLNVAGQNVIELAYQSEDATASELAASAGKLLTLLDSGPSQQSGEAKAVADELMDEIDGILTGVSVPGVVTGYRDLDEKLKPLAAGELLVIGARPGVGKSMLALCIAVSAAKLGKRAYVTSLEMSRKELMKRMVSMWTGIPIRDLSDREILRRRHGDIATALDEIRDLPIHIADQGGMTLSALTAKVRAQHVKAPLSLLVVDYLQILHAEREKGQSTADALAELAQGLKALAGEIEVPIIALSQLNREVEKRENRRPNMADLRDSGGIEAAADAVILMFRRQIEHSSVIEPTELVIDKQRNGERGTVLLGFHGARFKFVDMAHADIARYWESQK